MEQFRYLGATLKIQSSIREEIKSRQKSGNACYNSEQNLLSSSFVSKNINIRIYRTIILPVVLCGCETWSLPLRKQRKVKEFDRRVLIKECGPVEEKDEEKVTRQWRELHEEELYDLYSSPNVIPEMKSRRLRWPGHVAYMGDKKGAYRVWWRSLRKIHNIGKSRRR